MVHIIKLFKGDSCKYGEEYLLDDAYFRSKNIQKISDEIYNSFDKHNIAARDVLKIYCSLATNCIVLQTLQNICKTNNIFLITNIEDKNNSKLETYVMDITQNIEVHPNLINKINKHIILLGGT